MPALKHAEELVSADLDYLVVGGGTCGLVVATRLTEDPSCVVGVLEAGNDHENIPEISIPGLRGRTLFNPTFDWSFSTIPQKYVNGRQLSHPRGKGIGGSSAINFFALVRPGKAEIDGWEDLGNSGWNWDTMLAYMKKSEHLDSPKLPHAEAVRFAAVPESKNHGTDGPICKSFPPHVTEVHTAFLDALEANGLQRNPDTHGGLPVGAFLVPTSINPETGTRSHSGSAYYAPNISRPNLLVLTGAHATKVHLELVSGDLQRAVSVSFVKDGSTYNVRVKKEVIMSAGSFQTPQLLELSGIGDKDVLGSFDIETVIDLPGVGENLQDHMLVPAIVEVDPKLDTVETLSDPVQLAKHKTMYNEHKTGFLAGFPPTFAFIPAEIIAAPETVQTWISSSSIDASAAEVFRDTKPAVRRGIEREYEVIRTFIDNPKVPAAQFILYNGYWPIAGAAPQPKKRYITISSICSHPFSRGSVHIKSLSPHDHSAVQPNYFSNPADLDVTVKGLRLALNLFQTSPLKDLIVRNVVPNANATDEELKEHAKQYLATVFHPVGTCAMLPKVLGGVVDNKLLVYGTMNLRVIDCSIIPLQISANTQALAYGIGEKGADIIKGVF